MGNLSSDQILSDLIQVVILLLDILYRYPKQLAWRTNVDQKTFFQNDELKPISNFVNQEDKAVSLLPGG